MEPANTSALAALGWTPAGVALLGAAAWLLWRLLPAALSPRDRALATATLLPALGTLHVRTLGALGGLTRGALLASGAGVCAAMGLALARQRPRAAPITPRGDARGEPRALLDATSAGPLALGAVVVATALLAAWWLPVWQWDALGYHLPFVNFAIQSRGLAGVPLDAPYLGTYPHDVELLFVALRLLLPDDRLIDLGQIPFGLLGALATAGLARHAGARRSSALGAGALWLAVPCVFLQLPTNYVDVAAAAYLLLACYWLLAEPEPATALLFAVALGLFLGSKPTAPVGACVLAVAYAARAARAGHARWLVPGLAAVALLGLETYVTNLARHGNPLWPVRMDIGPLHLPGTGTVADLLAAGARAPRPHGPLPWRVLQSWFHFTAPPAFDMRLGGFGPVFALLALPAALLVLARRVRAADRGGAWTAALLASAAVASPSTARFVLALPALCLALAAAALPAAPAPRAALALACTALAAWAVGQAAPGLAGEGPPLLAYARMSPAARAAAVGPDGETAPWLAFQRGLGDADVVACDSGTSVLLYRLWRPDLRNRVAWLREGLSTEALERGLRAAGATYAVFGPESAGEALARAQPARFRPVLRSRDGGCAVYALARGAR